MELTKKQRTLLRYIIKYKKNHKETPSLRQSAVDLGVSYAAIAQLQKTLENKGVIKRSGKYGRHISILSSFEVQDEQQAAKIKQIPVIGTIAAGLPLYAQHEFDSSVIVDPERFPGENLFALTIKGDSMKNIAILDGDLAICSPRQFAENGEIIVALINNEEATVKRFFKRKNRIELRPENNSFEPIFYNFDEILIQGKVIGVIRSYT